MKDREAGIACPELSLRGLSRGILNEDVRPDSISLVPRARPSVDQSARCPARRRCYRLREQPGAVRSAPVSVPAPARGGRPARQPRTGTRFTAPRWSTLRLWRLPSCLTSSRPLALPSAPSAELQDVRVHCVRGKCGRGLPSRLSAIRPSTAAAVYIPAAPRRAQFSPVRSPAGRE